MWIFQNLNSGLILDRDCISCTNWGQKNLWKSPITSPWYNSQTKVTDTFIFISDIGKNVFYCSQFSKLVCQAFERPSAKLFWSKLERYENFNKNKGVIGPKPDNATMTMVTKYWLFSTKYTTEQALTQKEICGTVTLAAGWRGSKISFWALLYQ